MAKEKSGVSKIIEWLEGIRQRSPMQVTEIAIKDLDKWKTDPETGNIVHDSGKFFQVVGLKVESANNREVDSWTQPIIKQYECGILGILCKKIDGIMHYLLYAKYEPGSIAKNQLSPTLQATASNLAQVHHGKKPLFAEYFEEGGKGKVLVSVMQVEDPGRFYLKTNRCMIVEAPEDENIEIPEDFIWITESQIRELSKIDLVMSAVVRSVLASL